MILVEVISLHWYKLICWACPHRSAFCNALCSLSVSHGNCPHFPIMVIFVQDDPDNLTIAHLGLSQISSATYSSIRPSSSTFETGFLKNLSFPCSDRNVNFRPEILIRFLFSQQQSDLLCVASIFYFNFGLSLMLVHSLPSMHTVW